jgi:hypothetical protein
MRDSPSQMCPVSKAKRKREARSLTPMALSQDSTVFRIVSTLIPKHTLFGSGKAGGLPPIRGASIERLRFNYFVTPDSAPVVDGTQY